MTEKETAPEVVEKMIAEPTLDWFYQTNPVDLTDEQFREVITRGAADRARFIAAKESK